MSRFDRLSLENKLGNSEVEKFGKVFFVMKYAYKIYMYNMSL